MARDIRELFEKEEEVHEFMSKNHEVRFIKKLDKALPENKRANYSWFQIAASIVVLLGLTFGAYNYLKPIKVEVEPKVAEQYDVQTKSLGDISPGLKKVEDYYLASINLELSKMTYTPETKELFDDYLARLGELDEEYQKLSLELTEAGPSELTVNALIDNLKLRLNLLYRLRSQLKEFNNAPNQGVSKSI